jgi:hypothetical protein
MKKQTGTWNKPMTDKLFERYLVSIGLGAFVEFYLDFANESLTNGEVEENIWNAHKFTEKSCRSRTSHARSIINSGRGVEGLQRAANSKRLPQDQRKKAEPQNDQGNRAAANQL